MGWCYTQHLVVRPPESTDAHYLPPQEEFQKLGQLSREIL